MCVINAYRDAYEAAHDNPDAVALLRAGGPTAQQAGIAAAQESLRSLGATSRAAGAPPSLREWIAGLAPDSINCVVNAYRDAWEAHDLEDRQNGRAEQVAVESFRDALASLLGPAPAALRTERMDLHDELDRRFPMIDEFKAFVRQRHTDHSKPCPMCGDYWPDEGESAPAAPPETTRSQTEDQ
jgi:hypothetical protein